MKFHKRQKQWIADIICLLICYWIDPGDLGYAKEWVGGLRLAYIPCQYLHKPVLSSKNGHAPQFEVLGATAELEVQPHKTGTPQELWPPSIIDGPWSDLTRGIMPSWSASRYNSNMAPSGTISNNAIGGSNHYNDLRQLQPEEPLIQLSTAPPSPQTHPKDSGADGQDLLEIDSILSRRASKEKEKKCRLQH